MALGEKYRATNDKKEKELMMIKDLHEPRSILAFQKETGLARGTIEKWRDSFKDGYEFAGMRIKTDFEYGGTMQTTVHPILLPLNLAEVFALLTALTTYAEDHLGNPNAPVAQYLAGMVHGQLTDYAKSKVDPPLEGMEKLRWIRDVDNEFIKDNDRKSHRGSAAYGATLMKSGARVVVTYDVDGEELHAVGVIRFTPEL